MSLNLLTLLNDDDDDDDAGGVVGDDGHLAGICWQPVKANTLTRTHTHTTVLDNAIVWPLATK